MVQIQGNDLMSGGVPYSIGQASVVRIPVPGTEGLCIELKPRGFVPQGGSTSTLFIQDSKGARHLRLDYGYNIRTKTVDYHWNQKGVHANFGITDHTTVGRGGQAVYKAAKYFKYAGRVIIVTAVALDVVSIVRASKPPRRASEVVTGWALAWVGCKAGGATVGAVGTFATPIGTAIGGVIGWIVVGAGGYYADSAIGGEVYDWAEGTFFSPVPEIAQP